MADDSAIAAYSALMEVQFFDYVVIELLVPDLELDQLLPDRLLIHVFPDDLCRYVVRGGLLGVEDIGKYAHSEKAAGFPNEFC